MDQNLGFTQADIQDRFNANKYYKLNTVVTISAEVFIIHYN